MSGLHLDIPTDPAEIKRLIAAHSAAEQMHAAMVRALTWQENLNGLDGFEKLGRHAAYAIERDRSAHTAAGYLNQMPVIWSAGLVTGRIDMPPPLSAMEAAALDRGLKVIK